MSGRMSGLSDRTRRWTLLTRLAGSMLVAALLMLAGAEAAGATGQGALPVSELIEHAAEYDGQTVTVEGEAVGDLMLRGESGWVNISDPTGDIGVWAPAQALRQIRNLGHYQTRGDRLLVTGRFNRADPVHGGDLDLHAESLLVVASGGRVDHAIPKGSLWLALSALVLGGAMTLAARIRQRIGVK